jgi:DNA-binding GntR family transcriptional regulator
MPRPRPEVYSALREAISGGSIRANEPLREGRLAAALGVSRTPVREALVRLSAEGLVEADGTGGLRVADLRADDLDEVFALRTALESLAVRYACDVDNPDGIVELRRIHAASVEAVAADDVEQLLELNTAFHLALNRFAQKPRLQNLIEMLRDQSRRYRVLALYDREERRQSVREHGQFVDLVVAGKADEAVGLLRLHLLRPPQRLRTYLGPRSGDDPFSEGRGGR